MEVEGTGDDTIVGTFALDAGRGVRGVDDIYLGSGLFGHHVQGHRRSALASQIL